jgi:hypothetical protein
MSMPVGSERYLTMFVLYLPLSSKKLPNLHQLVGNFFDRRKSSTQDHLTTSPQTLQAEKMLILTADDNGSAISTQTIERHA